MAPRLSFDVSVHDLGLCVASLSLLLSLQVSVSNPSLVGHSLGIVFNLVVNRLDESKPREP